MSLPFDPPLAPMLSRSADALPDGEGWQFEPKWDGFRTLVFRDGDEIMLQSRDSRPMNRYFPELVEPLAAALPDRCVLDGEIVIAGRAGSSSRRCCCASIRPSRGSRCWRQQSPASYVAWDLLALGDEDLREAPLSERRERLEQVLGGCDSRPCTSRRRRGTALWQRTGSSASRAPGSTA